MSEYLDDLRYQVAMWDAERDRSMQAEVGWSELAGCERRLAYREQGQLATDSPDWWRATAGTALHDWMRFLRTDAHTVRHEVEVSYRGIPGHVDEWDRAANELTDWKFPSLVVSRRWQASEQELRMKMVQLMGYGAGLIEAGEADEGTLIVRLCVMPVDGTSEDWWTEEWPFDRELADWGVERLLGVRETLAEGGFPAVGEPYHWCEEFCEFFTACREPRDGVRPAGVEITRPDLVEAVQEYGLLGEEASTIKTRRDELAEVIRGLDGYAGGWRIRLSRAGAPRLELDVDRALADYAEWGVEPPLRTKPGAAPSLLVTRVRGAEEDPQ